MLLRVADCKPALCLPDFYAPPLLLEAPLAFTLGSFPPLPLPSLAASALLLLLLTELIVQALVLSSLCSLPHESGGCLATALVFPGAGILSPLVCLYILLHTTRVLRGVAQGHESALCRAASGHACRMLHVGAVWNVASLPNAAVAQIAFVFTPSFTADDYEEAHFWLLPLLLLLTKLLTAQAIKVLVASTGVSPSVWAMLAPSSADGTPAHAPLSASPLDLSATPTRRRRSTLNLLERINSLPRRSVSEACP